jgi:DNA-binding CsgD family transcriptional regulator
MDQEHSRNRFPLLAFAEIHWAESKRPVQGYVANIGLNGMGVYYVGSAVPNGEVRVRLHALRSDGRAVAETVEGTVYGYYEWENSGLIEVTFPETLSRDKTPTLFEHVKRQERLLEMQNVPPAARKIEISQLTPREYEVSELIIEGLSNKQISERLKISVRTVGVHRANIYSKLKIHNVAQLIRRMLEENPTAMIEHRG